MTAGVVAALLVAVVAGGPMVNGDTVFHLVWGRELVHGELDSFDNGPTPHPLLLMTGALTALLGDQGSFVATYVVFGPLALGAVAALMILIGRTVASAWTGIVAGVVLLTSLPILANAATARYDVAFAALVLAAVALEVRSPKRGTPTLCCLAVAGLIRPEAWVLAGVYWLWIARGLTWERRLATASLVAAAPVLWVLMDALVMGDPLYSFHVTDRGSDAFYRQFTPGENASAAWRNLLSFTGIVPVLAALPAVALLIKDRSRGAIPLIATLALTLAVFVVFLSRGLASSERYLFVPACMLALLAGFLADGGRRTRARVMVAVFVSVFIVAQATARSGVYGRVAEEASVVQGQNENIRALVAVPGVAEAMRRCPDVAVPSANMIQLFALRSGRSPDRFRSDSRGRTSPDLYIAPGNRTVAEDVLTRARFDDDATFRVPDSLVAGPRNEDWIAHVSPTSSCTQGLR